jgi:cell division protein FtsZ
MKIRQALEGVAALSEHVDALLVINNEKLREIFADLELSNAFAKADDVLTNAARGIAEIITVPGYINTDFADVYTILSKGNVAIMNTGYASGEKRITKAIQDALNSPLLNTNDVSGASKVLLNLYCSSAQEYQIKMEEVKEINEFMASIGEDIQVIWGAAFDDSLGENVKITLIATGYDVSDIPGMPASAKKKIRQQAALKTVTFDGDNEITEEPEAEQNDEPARPDIEKSIQTYYSSSIDKSKPVQAELPIEIDEEIETISLDLEDLDDEEVLEKSENIPAWKRMKNKLF